VLMSHVVPIYQVSASTSNEHGSYPRGGSVGGLA